MKSDTRHSSGFTLIELLVTVSIFVFMTALIISRYGAFNQGTLMTNLAYDVALSIRTAQSFGVSVKGTENTAGSAFKQSFSSAYAVHFDKTTTPPGAFFTYIDSNNNGQYDSSTEAPPYSTYTLKQGASITSMCMGTNGQTCSWSGLSALDVSFLRPDPSAIICATSGGNNSCSSGVVGNYAQIILTSGDGKSSRTITIRGNGQISVGN